MSVCQYITFLILKLLDCETIYLFQIYNLNILGSYLTKNLFFKPINYNQILTLINITIFLHGFLINIFLLIVKLEPNGEIYTSRNLRFEKVFMHDR